MSFNDFVTLSEKDYQVMKQSYDKILEQENNDLTEIYTKMSEQNARLSRLNVDSRYDQVITKMKDNISEIKRIIDTNQSNILYSPKVQETPQIRGITLLDNGDTAISPIRSKWENSGETPTTRTLRRGFPLQGGGFFGLFKSTIMRQKKEAKLPQNKYHNIISDPVTTSGHHCPHSDQIETHQVDLIRLLLLYLALRPNCKYISRLSSIASDQFDILLQLKKM